MPARFACAYRIQRRSLAMPQQLLGDRQAGQLRIRQRGFAAWPVIPRPAQRGQDTILEVHVKCRQEGVKLVRHKTIFDALRPTFRTATRAEIKPDSLIFGAYNPSLGQ
jgi:hypothetical protein